MKLSNKLALQNNVLRRLYVLVLKVVKLWLFPNNIILLQERTDKLDHFLILKNDKVKSVKIFCR